MERTKVIGQTFDEERALYNLTHGDVEGCIFAGPADGESVLKEARDVRVTDSSFSRRYPLWHAKGFTMERCTMDELTRAPIWYAADGTIIDSMWMWKDIDIRFLGERGINYCAIHIKKTSFYSL